MSIVDSSKRVPGPAVRIHCPACKGEDLRATSYSQSDFVLFYFVPLFKTTHWVVCPVCRSELYCRCAVESLPSDDPDEASRHLECYHPLICRFFAMAALTLGCFPFVGAALVGLGLYLNRRQTFWWRVALIGLALSVVTHALVIYHSLTH